MRTIADEIFEEAQLTPNILLETENIETVLALASKGMGITFYPKMFMSGNQDGSGSVMKKNGLNYFSLNYMRSHGILAFGMPQGQIPVPGYRRIYPHCQGKYIDFNCRLTNGA